MKNLIIIFLLLITSISYCQTGGNILSGNTIVGKLNLPMGEISYFDLTGTTITINNQSDGDSAMVKVNPTTIFDGNKEFDNGGTNDGRLRYTGTATKMFHIACTLSGSPVSLNDSFIFGVAQNGTVVTSSKIVQKFGQTTDNQSTAIHVMVTMDTNDYLELYVGNTSGSGNFTIKSLNLFAMGL